MQTINILLAVFCTVGGVVILALIAVVIMKNKTPATPPTSTSGRSKSARSRPGPRDEESHPSSVPEYEYQLRTPSRAHRDIYRVRRGISDRDLEEMLNNGPCDGHHTVIKIKRHR